MGLLRKFERAKNAYLGHDINGIKHYNWHSEDKSWVGDFIRSRFAQKDWKKLSVVSVFGSPRTFWFHKNENKIFFCIQVLMNKEGILLSRFFVQLNFYPDIQLN